MVADPTDLPAIMPVVDRLRVLGEDDAPEAYVDVELWGLDAQDHRRAPRRNRVAQGVDPDTWEAWIERGSATVTGLPLWDEVAFDIDAVFTWVDDADERWRAARAAHAPGATVEGASEERFLNRDEIYYAVAAARRRLPWLRRLIIVTDGQRHERIAAEFPEVEFVDHRDVFPDPSVLPVFNSHAIEATLHRIPGLAEHFLYFNDDMLVARPLAPSDFFSANGTARFFPSPLTIDWHADGQGEAHLHAAGRNRALLARDFRREIVHSLLHIPYPHRVSVLEEMDRRYAEEFAATRASRFRSGDDLSVLSSFAQYYGWLTERYSPGSLPYRFVRLHDTALERRLESVASDPDVAIVALGEPMPGQRHHPQEEALLHDFLERMVS